MARYVITGGPCTGKTTTLREIMARGYAVVEETARDIISNEREKSEKDKSYSPILPWTNISRFQRLVAEEQMRREEQATAIPVFIDRGLMDNLAYIQVFGGQLDDITASIVSRARYSKIFFLEQVPYVLDAARREDPELGRRIHEAIYEVYSSSKMEVLKVPWMAVQDRANFILCNL